jgi:hypothetical protein
VFKLFHYSFLLLSTSFLLMVNSFAQSVDPTKPLSAYGIADANHANKVTPLVLETIVYGDKVRTAIINGKVLKVGDTIGRHKVLVVNDKSVTLGLDDERLTLTIFSDVVVKSP